MIFKKKKKQENEEPVLTPENFYGNMRYRGKDIEGFDEVFDNRRME